MSDRTFTTESQHYMMTNVVLRLLQSLLNVRKCFVSLCLAAYDSLVIDNIGLKQHQGKVTSSNTTQIKTQDIPQQPLYTPSPETFINVDYHSQTFS